MARQWRIEYPGAFYHLFSRGNGRQDILLDDDDRYAAYRRKIQRYANEEKRIWEDVKYGLAYGSQEFIDRLKKRFIKDGKDVELPQRNRLMRDMDPQQLAKRGAIASGLDLCRIKAIRRVPARERSKRDMLIYFLWDSGRLSNQQIGSLRGVTYSNISRRVSIFKMEMTDDQRLRKDYMRFKSQIKV